MDEYTLKCWVARDLDDELWLHVDEKPEKDWMFWRSDGRQYRVPGKKTLPLVTWEDPEPTEVTITIKLTKQ